LAEDSISLALDNSLSAMASAFTWKDPLAMAERMASTLLLSTTSELWPSAPDTCVWDENVTVTLLPDAADLAAGRAVAADVVAGRSAGLLLPAMGEPNWISDIRSSFMALSKSFLGTVWKDYRQVLTKL
jgi:hypothetical protein